MIRHSSPVARIARGRLVAAASLLAALAGCLRDSPAGPAAAAPVRLGIAAQVAPAGRTLVVAVSYRRVGSLTDLPLVERRIALDPATTAVPVTVDITACLADGARERPTADGDACVLHVALTLLDENGAPLDVQALPGLDAASGQVVDAPPVSLGIQVATLDLTMPQPAINAIGYTATLGVAALDLRGQPVARPTVAFASLDPAVATVDDAGVVTARGNGQARIVGTARAALDTVVVTVRQYPSEVSLVATGDFTIGDSMPLATARDSNGVAIPGRELPLRILVGDADVVRYDMLTGRLHALTVGTASLDAEIGPVTARVYLRVVPPAPPTEVAAGSYHSCRRRADAAPECWGWNAYGQLGDGNGPSSARPDTVVGGLRFTSIAGSGLSMHFCGVAVGGAAYCWGANLQGQVGDGTTTVRNAPTAVAGGIAFTQLATGHNYESGAEWTCGVATDGAGWCWGDNALGQLGDGTTTSRLVPTPVAGGLRFTQMGTSNQTTCGLTTDGRAYCWGTNGAGNLGNAFAAAQQLVPGPVAGNPPPFVRLEQSTSVACALTAEGDAWCWGNNWGGQVGDGTVNGDHGTPAPAAGGMRFRAFAAGNAHACGVDLAGVLYCWGTGSGGRLGDNTTADHVTPQPVASTLRFDRVAVGVSSCAVSTTGETYCWGFNAQGQLGDGTFTERWVPTHVRGSALFVELAVGWITACARTAAGVVSCWGGLTNPIGTLMSALAPSVVADGAGLSGLTSGSHSGCALRNGAAYCWGLGSSGQLGDGTQPFARGVPGPTVGLPPLAQVTFGPAQTACAVTTTGVAYCWGQNNFGTVGDGTQTPRPSPVMVAGLPPVAAISSATSTCALARDGAAWCWGDNRAGALGDGTTTSRLSPAPVNFSRRFGAVVSGSLFACGLAGGAAYCWGSNAYGQLGDGTTTDRLLPTAVTGGLRFVALSASSAFVCGITATGEAWCWGDRSLGQLGDGAPQGSGPATSPVRVASASRFVAIAAGGVHVCASTSAGTVECWGWNNAGQLGDGTMVSRSTPAPTIR